MARTPEHFITLRLICTDRPPAAEREAIFGLQKGAQVLDPGTPQPDGAVRWECAVVVRQAPDDTLRFKGVCVHGTARDPFLYLAMAPVDEPTAWIRRWKIDLASIRSDDVRAALGGDGTVLEATVTELRGTRPALRDGGWAVVLAPSHGV